MNATPLEKLLSVIGDYRRSGKSYKARCPAHDDNSPSLSISAAKDGTVLVKCHAGCSAEPVVKALGLTMRDLFSNGDASRKSIKRPKTKGKIFATADSAVTELEKRLGPRTAWWTYEDATGESVAVVVRWDMADGKTFRPVAKIGGGWRIGDPDGLWPRYRLPELLKSSGPIFITEGEKKADALRALGFTVTTSAHGAQAAGGTDWTPLAGGDAVSLPDNDDAGAGYVADVLQILGQLVPKPSIRIMNLPGLPEAGDVVDFIANRRAAGLDDSAIRAEIQNLVDGAETVQAEAPEPDTPASWPSPKPIPNDLPAVLPFEYAMLPNAFVPYVRDVSERMQCPPDFPAVASMVALAGVVGKKIGIRPKRYDDWLVVVNLWGTVIGRPGIMKTPAIRDPFKFLQRLEIEAKDQFAHEYAAYEVKLWIAEEQKKKRKEAIAKAVQEGKNPEQAAQEILIEIPKEPSPRRYIVNDSTVEKLGELLNKNPNGLTAFRDEIIGLLENLDKEGQEGARAFYIEAWDGLGKFTYDRISRGTLEIDSVTLSVFGGIQPGRLASYLRAAVQGGAGDDGLMQRFQMAVYPDINAKWCNVDRWPDSDAKQKAWVVFQTMDTLNPMAVGANPDASVPFLRFDHDAQNLFDAWRAQLELRVRSGEEHPAIESHLAKYRSLVPSLALLTHLADGGIGPVTADATRKALAWARYLESHARRIYSIVTDPATAAAKALAKRIMKGDVGDGFTLRSVYRNAWAGLDKQSSELAVEILVELGWLIEVEIATPGKSKTAYRINPAILAKTRGGAN